MPDDTLRIRLFGVLELERDGRTLPAFPTRHARNLFAFLVLNRHRVHARERLQALSWGDVPAASARKYLRTALWRMRKVLEPEGEQRGGILCVRGDEIGIHPEADIWIDVEEFTERVDRADSPAADGLDRSDVVDLNRAVALYRGDLLEGVYEEWCLLEQERLRLLLLHGLEKLMTHHLSIGEGSRALEYGERLLAIDPLRESVHRQLMRIHYRMGNRPAALRQFERCARLLDAEFGIDPMGATVALRAAIRSERMDEPDASGAGGPREHGAHGEPRQPRESRERRRAREPRERKEHRHSRDPEQPREPRDDPAPGRTQGSPDASEPAPTAVPPVAAGAAEPPRRPEGAQRAMARFRAAADEFERALHHLRREVGIIDPRRAPDG